MPRDFSTHPIKSCPGCGTELPFDRSYGFHAGFSNLGFLYNELGNQIFVWSSFDPDYSAIVGEHHPWGLTKSQQEQVESQLRPSEGGGAWLFSNPARCDKCHASISGPITETIMALPFDGSLSADEPGINIEKTFGTYLKQG